MVNKENNYAFIDGANVSPYETEKCSVLLKRTGVKISYILDQKNILEFVKEKAPNEDKTSSGSLS